MCEALVIAAIFVVVPLVWVLLKMARWSAPLSGTVGLLILGASVAVESTRGMGFGAGLFVFSAISLVAGGSMEEP